MLGDAGRGEASRDKGKGKGNGNGNGSMDPVALELAEDSVVVGVGSIPSAPPRDPFYVEGVSESWNILGRWFSKGVARPRKAASGCRYNFERPHEITREADSSTSRALREDVSD